MPTPEKKLLFLGRDAEFIIDIAWGNADWRHAETSGEEELKEEDSAERADQGKVKTDVCLPLQLRVCHTLADIGAKKVLSHNRRGKLD